MGCLLIKISIISNTKVKIENPPISYANDVILYMYV